MTAPVTRTTHQLVSKDGPPAKAVMTSNLWVSRPGVFSQPTFGNQIKALVTGADYFDDLIKALDSAAPDSEVLMAGWQINWDALLAPGVRLYDVMYRNAKRGLRFYVMPWDDTNPIQTYEAQTKIVLESINKRLREEGAGQGGSVSVVVAGSQSDRNAAYFSHHQKQVVIGRQIAYVGGLDLAYGRFDDARFDLYSKAQGRKFLNSYNPGLPPMKKLRTSGMADPDLMSGAGDRFDAPYVGAASNAKAERSKIESGAYQIRYQANGPVANFNQPALEGNEPDLRTLSESQPRMPWQDVHCRIEGPSVMDLTRNFVRRWNSLAPVSQRLQAAVIPKPTPPDKTSACIQVLRSAPVAMQTAEQRLDKPPATQSSGVEDDIHAAMKRLIGKADHFIYIESQFLVSAFGAMSHGLDDDLSPASQFIKDNAGGISDAKLIAMRGANADRLSRAELDRLPQNGVCAALIERITRAILDHKRPNFHVYITLPVHPEGSLLDGAVAVQVYYTMQSLVFGSHSLINGIKRALKARELMDANDAGRRQALDENATGHEDIEIEACFKYVTLLKLRNCAQRPDGSVVTEQVYVHTKLMIVDDLYALLGSANVNDRSLLGMRDSEIAVLVEDGRTARADINGTGSQRPVRLFAHDLRRQIWSKLFGITGNVRPATELKQAIDQPGSPDSWKLIQRRAATNAELYEAAFAFVPRSRVMGSDDKPRPASILPTWKDRVAPEPSGKPNPPLPYQDEFWQTKPLVVSEAMKGLHNVKGFVTALPIGWTRNENLRIPYPTSLIVRTEDGTPSDVNASTLAQTTRQPSKGGSIG
jgi:phospholipase D1/2